VAGFGLKRASATALFAAAALGVWLISPRFSIGGPSLVDDWFAVHFSPGQVGSLGRWFSTTDGRFRPGWIGWNYVQWHTFSAPADMLGPNVWDVLRLLVFVVGVALLTQLLCRSVAAQQGTGTNALLAVAPALLVVTTPQVAVDFARFGPQEPLVVGCMALGGSLLFLGAREWSLPSRRRPGRIAACLVLGYAFWVVGVYQKEISVSVLALLPFLYVARRTQVNQTVKRLGTRGRWLVAALCAAVLAPVAHVALEVALITHRGNLAYNGNQVSPGTGAVRKTVKFIAEWPSATGSILGLLLTLALTIHVARRLARRRPDWLMSGLLAAALVCLAWGGQSGVFPSRYYIPSLTLVAIGVMLILAQAGRAERRLALAAALLVFAGSSYLAHRDVHRWAVDDQRGHILVEAVAAARSSGCPVAETGVDPERAESLPILSSLAASHSKAPPCSRVAFALVGPHPDPALIAACPRSERTQVGLWVLQQESLRLIRCSGLTPSGVRLFSARRFR
jgi:hypothetical protein